jgi:hypothetical protein
MPHLLSDTEWQKRWKDKGLSVPEKLAVWIPRQYNPVWINPDGFRWIEVLRDESQLELTFNPSPTWSETNWFMDYILPVGLSGERHDQHSEPTNTEAWVAFRQPVLRVALEKSGWAPKDPARATLEAHVKAGLGEIWEENELWVNLLFHYVDSDGSLGIRQFWESRENPGKPVTIAEYYNAAFATLPPQGAAEAARRRCRQALWSSSWLPSPSTLAMIHARSRAWTEKIDVFNQHQAAGRRGRAREDESPQWFGGMVEYTLKDVKTDARAAGHVDAPGATSSASSRKTESSSPACHAEQNSRFAAS